MSKRDGGPAFPRVGEGFGNPNYDAPGMSLRDYFAAHAPPMEKWWADMQRGKDKLRAEKDDRYQMRDDSALHALWSYNHADAMLAARERPHE